VAADSGAAPVWKGPFKANSTTGTHFFPAIAVGDPGRVDVAWIRTDKVIPMLPYGKPQPGGGAGASWWLYTAQTQDLFAEGGPTWTQQQLTPSTIHVGDVCTLGIFCVFPDSDRDLLDFIDIAIDPRGLAHVAYTADVPSATGIYVANQTGGPGVVDTKPPRH
jgi:hypothetical protein